MQRRHAEAYLIISKNKKVKGGGDYGNFSTACIFNTILKIQPPEI